MGRALDQVLDTRGFLDGHHLSGVHGCHVRAPHLSVFDPVDQMAVPKCFSIGPRGHSNSAAKRVASGRIRDPQPPSLERLGPAFRDEAGRMAVAGGPSDPADLFVLRRVR